ncbi:MAG: four helix bundle protein [Acidobacteriota bacterium]|nr:four helix bundle protein [Acidobacteriota bacterium]
MDGEAERRGNRESIRQKAKGKMEKKGKEFLDIRERAFAFAVRIIRLCQFLEKHSNVSKTLIHQLLNAGTSVGANLEEAQSGQGKPDFIHQNAIALKEARETNYWLRLIPATADLDEKITIGIDELITESAEIKKVIGSIIVSAKK